MSGKASTRRPASNPLDWMASASRIRSPWGRGIAYLFLIYALVLWLSYIALKPMLIVAGKGCALAWPHVKRGGKAALVKVLSFRTEEINMTGPANPGRGSYDKDGLPW